MSYLTKDFLLENKYAKKLYFDYAAKAPIFDYHCHLSEYQIFEDKEFENIYQIWLSGDHYKWRLMRNYGVDEAYITGNKSDKEKFIAYCKVLGLALANPLYHWSQLELQMFFNCNLEINETNALKIWEQCNAYIKANHNSPSKLIISSNVKAIFTTNEIFDDLDIFEKIKTKNYPFKVLPAFRADKIMNIDAKEYNSYVDKLGSVKTLKDLEKAVEDRLDAFLKAGALASDTALEQVYDIASEKEAAAIFLERRKGNEITTEEAEAFKGYFTYFLLGLYGKKNVCSELHLGAMRNNNTKMFNLIGADTGYDSVSDACSTKKLSALLDKLNSEDKLPPIILFNLNPKMNTELVTLMAAFQDSSKQGKMQYGPAWWFLDNKVGMLRHLDDLTSNGHLGAFVGMLTDSRSFLSYARHHYFRRILCNFLGNLMMKGEITKDLKLVGKVVEDISINNSVNYFNLK